MLDEPEGTHSYASYLWNHIGTVACWARSIKKVNEETLSFERDDGLYDLHFFTRRDILIGAQRAADFFTSTPGAPLLPIEVHHQAVALAEGRWDNPPTHRMFVDAALQLAVFEMIEFPLSPVRSTDRVLLSA